MLKLVLESITDSDVHDIVMVANRLVDLMINSDVDEHIKDQLLMYHNDITRGIASNDSALSVATAAKVFCMVKGKSDA